MSEPDLILVRHAKTAFNVLGGNGRVCGGGSDPSLNIEGKVQARALRRIAIETRPDTVISSPQIRAQETATYLTGSDWDIVTEGWLREIHYGDWEGRSKEELQNDSRWLEYERDSWLTAPPGGESPEEAYERVKAGLRALPDGRVMLVGHKTVFRLLIQAVTQGPPEEYRTFDIRLASVTSISRKMRTVIALSSRSHLNE